MEFHPPIYDGVVHAAYAGRRDDVVALVPEDANSVLDIGCSVGALGEVLSARGQLVTGIESNAEMASAARTKLAHLFEADVEELVRSQRDVGGPFDCVVMADVLEHLADPWAVTRWAAKQLGPNGCLVISVPNIRHAHLVGSVLLRRRWPYEDVGIFDRTHLRWFARKNLVDLLGDTGMDIAELRRTYALSLNPAARVNRMARYLGDFGTLQFLFRAEFR